MVSFQAVNIKRTYYAYNKLTVAAAVQKCNCEILNNVRKCKQHPAVIFGSWFIAFFIGKIMLYSNAGMFEVKTAVDVKRFKRRSFCLAMKKNHEPYKRMVRFSV